MMLKGNFVGVKESVSVFTLEKKFNIEKSGRVSLQATALGLYFAEINGTRVGEAYLTPGWTSYNKMLQVQEYDITDLVQIGENTISLTVGEGWYCGRVVRSKNHYGEKIAVCADITLDGECILKTDIDWRARKSHIIESGIYDGEIIDLTAPLDALEPLKIDFNKNVLVSQINEPVRTVETLPAKRKFFTPAGELVYDFGQNISGVVEVTTADDFDGTVELSFAEILVDGNFYTENMRGAKATDIFTIRGAHTMSPEFTYHGFRYMRLKGADLPLESVNALVRHIDMTRSGYISTDNLRFQRLYENVIWGQRDNFVDVPTDCPQRDERLGWTGDINAFCRTAAYNYDIRKTIKKWLADVRNDQNNSGEVPHVVPDCLGDIHTSAMWGDCITMIPWTLWEMYGDASFLSDNYEAMSSFIAARERTMTDGLINSGAEFGDWLSLDVELLLVNDACGRTDHYFMTNVFHSHSLKIMSEAALILGYSDDAMMYQNKYREHLMLLRNEYFTPSGRFALDTVTAMTLALHFDIVPDEHRSMLADTLNKAVIKRGWRISTGFIGTPYLLFALADNGYIETARRVLLNNAYPGWLYEVDMGATTVWERWNSLMPDGTPNPDGMNSYNHYAYGSVMEFAYRRIAGIEAAAPGFKKIKISPTPLKGLPKFEASYRSVSGNIISKYENIGEKIIYTIRIPDGIEAEICIPNEKPVFVVGGEHIFTRLCDSLECEPYSEDSTVTEVFDNPIAVKAFNEVFGNIFVGREIAWMKNKPETLRFMAEFRDMEGKMKLSEFPDMLSEANRLFKKYTRNKYE